MWWARGGGPEDLGLRWTDRHHERLALAIAVRADRDGGSDRNDTSRRSSFQVSGADPDVGPIASMGRSRNGITRSPIFWERRLTAVFEMPLMPPPAFHRISHRRNLLRRLRPWPWLNRRQRVEIFGCKPSRCRRGTAYPFWLSSWHLTPRRMSPKQSAAARRSAGRYVNIAIAVPERERARQHCFVLPACGHNVAPSQETTSGA
jgi:hypothetical protein